MLFIALLLGIVQPIATPKVILFYGDSLTAGYGLSTDEAFPALVEKKLNKNVSPPRKSA